MTNKTSRESRMVQVKLADGKQGHCDPEIQDMVQALNDGGFQTIASCSGHGHRPATIALADGREILVLRNYEEARSLDKNWPSINGNKTQELWAMTDESGYVYPHTVRYLKKDVIEYLNKDEENWTHLQSIGRTISKIGVQIK